MHVQVIQIAVREKDVDLDNVLTFVLEYYVVPMPNVEMEDASLMKAIAFRMPNALLLSNAKEVYVLPLINVPLLSVLLGILVIMANAFQMDNVFMIGNVLLEKSVSAITVLMPVEVLNALQEDNVKLDHVYQLIFVQLLLASLGLGVKMGNVSLFIQHASRTLIVKILNFAWKISVQIDVL